MEKITVSSAKLMNTMACVTQFKYRGFKTVQSQKHRKSKRVGGSSRGYETNKTSSS